MDGIIVRIKLKNFVTYKDIEIYPEQNLNILVGPNGCGKSTIVSAIVLGLGGKPRTIGRGSNVGSYVKEGYEEGSVEIELLKCNGRNYVIRRNIVRANNKTSWFLNGQSASQKQIDEAMAKLNIQVDNLCQFLPQDRVQDFSRMDQKSLLENTEKAVGSAEMFEQHMQLKELRGNQIEMEKNISSITTQLENEQQKNDRIAIQATNITKKKQFIEDIYLLKQKRAWVKYDELKDKLEETKQDMFLAQKAYNKQQKKYEPIEKELEQSRKKISLMQTQLQTLNRGCSKGHAELKQKLDMTEQTLEKVNDHKRNYLNKIQLDENRQEGYRKLQLTIDSLRNDLNNLDPILDQKRKEEINTVLMPVMAELNEKHRILNFKVTDLGNEMQALNQEFLADDNEKNKINNVLNQRLLILQRKHRDVYQSVRWLRENKHLFKGRIFEPMMMEINVINPKYAKVVEAHIPLRDLLAFTCEIKDDMEKLLEIMREEKGWMVNVVHSGADHQPSHSFHPREPIEKISHYGFFSYIRELFTAPETIMKYLCRNVQVHCIPVGDKKTFSIATTLPPHFRCFYADNHCFGVKYSKYTNEKSTRATEIDDAFHLAVCVDANALSAIEIRLQNLKHSREQKSVMISSMQSEIKNIEEELEKYRQRKKELSTELLQRSSIESRITRKLDALREMERVKVDLNTVKEDYQKLQKEELKKLVAHQEEALEKTKNFLVQNRDRNVLQGEVLRTKDLTMKLQTDAEEFKNQVKAAETLFQTLQRRYATSKNELKQYFTIAKELTDDACPTDKEAFQIFEQAFQSLPDTCEDIDRSIQATQAKVDCMGNESDGLLEEYENRNKTIEELTERVATLQVKVHHLQNQISQIKEQWLPPLEHLINRINEQFGASFRKIRCVGQVALSISDNENDFHNYGLSIKVMFRNGEPLQQLNQFVQSGGERAVATAIYMISLQELTKVPFRCVDEINQGMDPINERMVFDLLVRTTSQKDTAQYFLLTPKLLPSLKYVPTINVLTVNNGEQSLPHSAWNLEQFIKTKRSQKKQRIGH